MSDAVPQEPRQATAATQPYPRGDAIVPQQVDIAPEGYELVNGGRIFTPFFGEKGVIASPSLFGGANWPPSSYDPVRHQLFVCASDVPGNFTGGHADNEPPPVGKELPGRRRGLRRIAPQRHLRRAWMCAPTSWSGASAGWTSATAVRWQRRAGWCSWVATMAVSPRSMRTTARCCGSSRPAQA